MAGIEPGWLLALTRGGPERGSPLGEVYDGELVCDPVWARQVERSPTGRHGSTRSARRRRKFRDETLPTFRDGSQSVT
ncbi:hypothetical protein ACWDSJ_26350 [Nocardia sp. NPDC003482]